LTKQLLSVAYISFLTKLQTSHHSEVNGLEMTKFGEKHTAIIVHYKIVLDKLLQFNTMTTPTIQNYQ